MSIQEWAKRFEAALEELHGDKEHIEGLIAEVLAELMSAQSELLGIDAACEGELARLEAKGCKLPPE